MAASLQDQGILGSEPVFVQRVRSSMLAAAVAISSDGLSTGINIKRHTLVQNVMTSPDSWKAIFAAAVATDASVGTDALGGLSADGNGNSLVQTTTVNGVTSGNSASQSLKVTDAHINTAVSSMWNAMFGGQ